MIKTAINNATNRGQNIIKCLELIKESKLRHGERYLSVEGSHETNDGGKILKYNVVR